MGLPNAEASPRQARSKSTRMIKDLRAAGFTPLDRSAPTPPAPALLDLDLGSLDQRPPFRDFGLLVRVERLRVLPLGWEDVLSDHGELGLHRGVGERLDHGGIQLGHDGLRRAL